MAELVSERAAIAKHRFADISPTKVRPIARLLRGKFVDDALDILRQLPNRGARYLEKVIMSAVANLEDRGIRDVDEAEIVEVRVDEGPRMKRVQPRARGTAYMIVRRLSHIEVTVEVF